MLRRSEALPDLRERKRFTGPLDIRAPEDHAVVEQQKAPAAPIWSPAIKRALGDFGTAMRSGVVDEMKRAARDVVDATSAYYRMSGVPTFAHEPVPWQLIEHVLPIERLEPGKHAESVVGRFVDLFDGSVKPMLKTQLSKYFAQPAIVEELKSGELGDMPHEANGPDSLEHWRRSGELRNSTYSTSMNSVSKFLGPRSNHNLGESPIQDIESINPNPERGRQSVDGESHVRKGAGVWASSAESAATDRFGRRAGDVAKQEGNGVPLFLPLIVGVAARERASKAIRSAGYSIAADVVVTLIANRLKPEEERKWPTWQSLVMSGLTGAASGVVDLGPGQWKWEVGVAFLGSVAEDELDGKPTRWLAAIGAGVGAGLYAKYGKDTFKAKYGERPLAQGAGKFISKAIKEIFSAEVELTSAEIAEFVEGFMRAVQNAEEATDYWQRQFDEWFWQNDQEPFP